MTMLIKRFKSNELKNLNPGSHISPRSQEATVVITKDLLSDISVPVKTSYWLLLSSRFKVSHPQSLDS